MNALAIPEEFNGVGIDYVTLAIIIEELAWGNTDFSAIFNTNLHAIQTILIGSSEAKKKELFPLIMDPAGVLLSFCITEEKGASDSSFFSTTARLENHQFVINGKKSVVFNAGESMFYIVWANMTDRADRSGINAFIVPADAEGITAIPYLNKPGHGGSPVASVSFEDVSIPEENLIGLYGSGYVQMMQCIDIGRVFTAAAAVGTARAAFEEALGFSKNRMIKNRPIISNQGVGFVLAELATALEAARMLVLRAARLIETGRDYTAAASMAKLSATELAVRATSEGLMIMGQKACLGMSLMAKLQRDAQQMRIIEGTSQIQKAIIANLL